MEKSLLHDDFSTLLKRKIIFVGGKGGVGKTTCASALSLYTSEQGIKTLLISTDPAHSSSDIFDRDLSGGEIVQISPTLYSIEINPEKETQRYIDDVKDRLRETISPVLFGEIEKQVDLALISPGAEESALFHRFTDLIVNKEKEYDIMIFDTAPTGHTLRLLTLPELMTAWIEGMISQRKKVNSLKRMWENLSNKMNKEDITLKVLEERRNQFKKARDLLMKKGYTAFLFVLTPEKLPILETLKAIKLLEQHHIPVEGIIVNKILPKNATGEFFDKRKNQEERYVKEIKEKFRGKLLLYNQLAHSDVRGVDLLKEFAYSFRKY